MNEETIERIEQYLNGELSPEQKNLFERELQTNQELQKQVEFMRSLPKAVQLSAENAIRKQLKELESKLPKVESKTQKLGEPAKIIPMPNPVSGSRWMQYAVAASILLLVGLFIFKDQIFTSGRVEQIAKQSDLIDTLNTIVDLEGQKPKQLAVSVLDVTDITDDKFGFVKNSLEKKITLIVEIDTSLLNQGVNYGLYKFQRDSLFVLTGTLETKIKIFYFDIKAQSGQMIDSTTGELLVYEKPALKGLFAYGMGSFFRIENKTAFSPLSKVNAAERELLKFYTK